MRWRRVAGILGAAAGITAPLRAQAISGNVFGVVADVQGGKLPGATATLSGCGAPQTTTTDSLGGFRFLYLAPCTYAVRVELPGFATVDRDNVVVAVGRDTEIAVELPIAPVSTSVTVTSESPLIDTRRQTSGTSFDNQELKSLPTARDPWALLQQTPAVLLDRQNVGGSESDQQANSVGKGTDPSQNAWNVDGVSVTDMVTTGLSSTYFDFDAFEEMQITTGGSDPSVGVPGVTINLVTKRGVNTVHGSARFFDTPNQLEARPTTVAGGAPSNSVDHIDDFGIEAGGPLLPDRAWLWGSYGKDQIDKLVAGETDRTTLENYAGKLNVQPIEANAFTLFFFRGDKDVFGRNASPTRPQPTTWDQTGPTTIWKGDDTQVFSPQFIADANWSWEAGGFSLTPEGGNVDAWQDRNGVWQASFQRFDTVRPQHQVNASLSAFLNTHDISHELKFGFGYRKYGVASISAWPGDGDVGFENYQQQGFAIAKLTRPKIINQVGKYLDAFIGDTISSTDVTLNLGLRLDDQTSRNLPSFVPENPTFPDLLGQVNYPGGEGVHFRDWQPRVGLTYALGGRPQTLLHVSYSRFADQLGAGAATFTNPIGYQYLYYHWTDANGNHRVDPGELGDFYGAVGVNPNGPDVVVPGNEVAHGLNNTKTDEFMIGVDHEILPGFVAGLTYTYRHRFDFIWTPYTQLTSANFVLASPGVEGFDQNGRPIGTTGPIDACVFEGSGCGLAPQFTFARTEENRPAYSIDYHALELSVVKRLTNRWMAHASITWNSWRQLIDDKSRACQDPTDQLGVIGDSCDSQIAYAGSGNGSGSFADVYINARWSFNVAALYQLPGNFNVAANFYGRQGYPAPYYVSVGAIVPGTNGTDGLGARQAIVGNPDDHRNPDLFQLDLRVEKVVPLFAKADLTLSVDLFNALDRKTVLQQEINATPGNDGRSLAGRVYEVQNPRILRLGARLTF